MNTTKFAKTQKIDKVKVKITFEKLLTLKELNIRIMLSCLCSVPAKTSARKSGCSFE